MQKWNKSKRSFVLAFYYSFSLRSISVYGEKIKHLVKPTMGPEKKYVTV